MNRARSRGRVRGTGVSADAGLSYAVPPFGCRSWTYAPARGVGVCRGPDVPAPVAVLRNGPAAQGEPGARRPTRRRRSAADLAIEYQADAADLGFVMSVGTSRGPPAFEGQHGSAQRRCWATCWLILVQEPENRVFGHRRGARARCSGPRSLGDRREVLFPPVREGDRRLLRQRPPLVCASRPGSGDRVDVHRVPVHRGHHAADPGAGPPAR